MTTVHLTSSLLPSGLPQPDVTLSSSGDSTAGQKYSLQCSAGVVAGLVVLPDLVLVAPNRSAMASQMNAAVLSHTFSSLRTSDGGQYNCTATVTIPEAGITGLHSSAVETVTVASELVSHTAFPIMIPSVTGIHFIVHSSSSQHNLFWTTGDPS